MRCSAYGNGGAPIVATHGAGFDVKESHRIRHGASRRRDTKAATATLVVS